MTKTVLSIVGIIVFVALLAYGRERYFHNYVNDWASDHNFTVAEIDQRFLDCGPYYYRGKGQSVYKVTFNGNNNQRVVLWFRFGLYTEIYHSNGDAFE